ncbi:MAG TPA: PIG-L family deacetylase, partial [Candidatus Saccharimonadales bacterium]|nr:PIG-L family deacetylase [Candidatus Saccharimonadales bacterium]
MNPYQTFVRSISEALKQGQSAPLGGFPFLPNPSLPADAPKVLIFAPHPDDEVIIGGLPLRLLRELKMNVLNVAVTQGSNKERQHERLTELQNCCRYIGFGLIQTRETGLEGVNVKTRAQNAVEWERSVAIIIEILSQQQPSVIFFPHDRDWNSSHIGTHHLVMDALKQMPPDFETFAVETEFWGAMDAPNLMVESSEKDLVDLITALTFHVGEVKRNPYHVRLPAWMI